MFLTSIAATEPLSVPKIPLGRLYVFSRPCTSDFGGLRLPVMGEVHTGGVSSSGRVTNKRVLLTKVACNYWHIYMFVSAPLRKTLAASFSFFCPCKICTATSRSLKKSDESSISKQRSKASVEDSSSKHRRERERERERESKAAFKGLLGRFLIETM